MFRLSLVLLFLAVVSSASWAQLPPLIDRELFFDDPEISGGQLSPDGKYVTFLKPFRGVRNVWVKEFGQNFEAARPITADTTRPILSYFWSRDSKFVLYAQDKGGDENYRIYAVDPAATGDPVPASRDLTPLEKVRAMIIDVPKGTPQEIIVGLNDRRADLHDVYRLNIATGERMLIRKNDENIAGWMTDLDGKLRLGLRITQTGGTEILQVRGDTLTRIYDVSAEESAGPVRFTPDGKAFYLTTNKGTLDKMQLELYDLATGKTALVERDPKNEADFATALFSDVTNELLATVYVGDRVRLYPKQKKFGTDWEKLKKALPPGEINLVSETADESLWLVSVSSDTDPASVYTFTRTSGEAKLLYRTRPKLPSEHLAPMKPVRYKARDGMSIPAYLVTPKGVPAKSLPAVMLIHGGPWARVMWGYNSEAQYLANRGYAVLVPNFRGSTGYGKKFLNAGNKQWGTGAMQHDISDGVKYLVKQKIADPKRVAIYGGSYGGYATLAGLAFTPDLYAAGISYVGPSNIITLLNSIPPYWAPVKKIFSVRVGDQDNPADRARLEAQSPLNFAKSITSPLLVVQGANDPRVKKAESDQIVVALRDLGRSVEYMVAPDEGHGFAGRDNRLAMYTAMERFFAQHLGGRIQESISTPTKARLDALTVDVKTVVMPVRTASGEPVPPAQFNAKAMKAAQTTYNQTVAARGQTITATATRSVAEAEFQGKKVWRIVEATSGAMGSAADTLDLDAASLLPLRRGVQQGPMTIALAFGPAGVKGKISGGMEMPIDVKTAGIVLSDGPGVELPVTTLPLAKGYKASFSVFDIMGGKANAMVLEVGAQEKVTTPAGTFDAHVVSITRADGEPGAIKLWVDAASKVVVKNETQLPAMMGGGTAVSELVK